LPNRQAASIIVWEYHMAQNGGTTRVGGFEIVSRIGKGGMGAVYKARQVSLDRIVALKILPRSLAKQHDFVTRFMREARAAGKLQHPNIVAGIDVGEADGYHYFAMEYVEGETASALTAREGALDSERTVRILIDVAKGLAHAHENGLLHRDVKPQNILIEKSGKVKLCDLGLARSTQEDSSLTQTGTAMGTPYYMSPEQIAGSRDIDARTDIYSLGAVGYHLLAGRPPYEAETAAMVMAKHVSEKLAPLAKLSPDVDPNLAAVIEKCLKKKPDDRYANTADLLEDLEHVAAGEPPAHARVRRSAAVGAAGGRAARTPARREGLAEHVAGHGSFPKWIPIAAATALFVGIGLIWAVFSRRPPTRPTAALTIPKKEPVKAPMKKEPVTAQEPVKPEPKDKLEEMFQYVLKWIEEHPEEFAEGKKRLEAVGKKAEATKYEFMVRDEVEKLEARRFQAVEDWFAELAEKSDALASAGNYDGAAATWAALPEKFAAALEKRAREKTAELTTAAEEKINTALTEVANELKAGEPEKGQAALSKVEQLKYKALADKVAAAKKELADAIANVGETKKKKALADAEKKVAEYMDTFDKAMLAGDYATAGKAISTAQRDGQTVPLADRLKAAKELVDGFDAAKEAERQALRSLIGTQTELKLTNGETHKGEIADVKDGAIAMSIKMEMPGGGGKVEMVRKFRIADLDEKCRKELMPKPDGPETGGQTLARAVLAMASNDLDQADVLLGGVKSHPLKEHYIRKALKLRLGAAEVAAQDAWQAIQKSGGGEKKLDRPTAMKLREMVTEFEKAHGETECVKGLGETLEALKLRIAMAFEVTSYKGVWADRQPTFIGVDGKPTTAPNVAHCGAAYDSKRRVCVLFGSGTYNNFRNDLWAYDPAKNVWTCWHDNDPQKGGKALPKAYFPGGATSLAFAYDRDQDRYWVFSEGSLWSFDPSAKKWRKEPAFQMPGGKATKCFQGMGYHPVLKSLVAVCGPFDPKTGSVDPVVTPPGTVNYGWQPSTAVMSNGLSMPDENGCYIAFGKSTRGEENIEPTTWQFDPAKATWTVLKPKQSPSARTTANMVYHAGLKVWMLYGGFHYKDREALRDTWIYAPHLNTWLELKSDLMPVACNSGALWYDEENDQVIFFGGSRRNKQTFALKITPAY